MEAEKKSELDEHEFARRRLTAAAYGFASWSEFRAWRKRNPAAYRERSRQLLELSGPPGERGMVVDLFAHAKRARRQPATREEPAGS